MPDDLNMHSLAVLLLRSLYRLKSSSTYIAHTTSPSLTTAMSDDEVYVPVVRTNQPAVSEEADEPEAHVKNDVDDKPVSLHFFADYGQYMDVLCGILIDDIIK